MQKSRLIFANPVFVFASSWGIVLLLHSFQLLAVLEPANFASLLLVITNVYGFFVIYTVLRLTNYANSMNTTKRPIVLIDSEVVFLEKYANILFIIWIVGTVINVLFSGGIPLYWMMHDRQLDYRNYGIPTFGGFIAAINTFLAVTYLIIFMKKPRLKIFITTLVLMSWPIIVVSRGNFTYLLLEMLGAYLILNNKFNFKKNILILLMIISFIYVFGVIGDFRLGPDRVAEFKRGLFNPDYIEMADLLPSGVIYIYAYITTPFNNLVHNINYLNPSFMPYHSIIFLFPTIVRGLIYDGGIIGYTLVSDVFNTVTFYMGYLIDFGIAGTLIIISIYQIGAAVFYLQALKGRIAYIIAYSTVFQCIVLSIFNDNFTMHMSIFQIILALSFEKLYRRKCKSVLHKSKINE